MAEGLSRPGQPVGMSMVPESFSGSFRRSIEPDPFTFILHHQEAEAGGSNI